MDVCTHNGVQALLSLTWWCSVFPQSFSSRICFPSILSPHRGKHKRSSVHEATSIHSKTIDQSVEIIAGYCSQILDRICGSAEQCPRILRVALRQLWQRVEERFSGSEYKVGLGRWGDKEFSVL